MMGRRASLDARRLPFQMGQGRTVSYYIWPRKLRDKVGDAFLDRVDEAITKGEDLKATDKVFVNKIADRNPEIKPTIDSVLETVAKLSKEDMQARVGTGVQEF
jgi:hypothetical protein